MLNSITMKNVRCHKDKTVELTQINLITGPNGSGKSTVSVAWHLLLLGYVPGYGPNDVIANANGDTMEISGLIDDKTLVRRWKRNGDKVSSQVELGDTKANKNSATALIEGAFGPDPLVLDLSLFYALTGPQQRKSILKRCSEIDVDKLIEAEQRLRDDRNRLFDDNRRLQHELQGRTERSGSLVPVSIDKVYAEIEELKAGRRTYETQVNKKERLRGKLDQLNAQGPTIDRDIAAERSKIEDLSKRLATGIAQLEDLRAKAEQDKPVDNSKAIITPPAVYQVVEDARGLLVELHGLTAQKALEVLSVLVLDLAPANNYDADITRHERGIAQIQQTISTIRENIANLETKKAEIPALIQGITSEMLEYAPEAEQLLAGIDQQIDEKMKLYSNSKAINQEIEHIGNVRNQIRGNEIRLEELKEELDNNVADQNKALGLLREYLATKSETILPAGVIDFASEGRTFNLFWKNGNAVTNRNSLSGAEQLIFDLALAFVIAPKATLFLEAAELDSHSMSTMIEKIKSIGRQTVLMTCHDVQVNSADVNVISMG